jgi:hypothetical protein
MASSAIRFDRDYAGGVQWAHLPDSPLSLARFTSTGEVMMTANAFSGDGTWITMDNPEFAYADSFASFKRLAERFLAEGRS